jgi:large subunit ribosomal protein L4
VCSSDLKDKEVMVIDGISIDSPKTKEYLTILTNLKVSDKKTLLLTTDSNSNVYLSARNIPNAIVMNATDVNTYNILNANNIILEAGAIDKLKDTLS